MINVNGETMQVTAQGTLLDITSEILCIIGDIYNEYKQKNSQAAELFKEAIISELNDKDFWKTVEGKK